jgi:hypothetical protein
MYPDCPYQAAWNPAMPAGTRAGGGRPGPVDDAHVARAGAGVTTDPSTNMSARMVLT